MDELALLYQPLDGKMERLADSRVTKDSLRMYINPRYDSGEVSALVPTTIDGISFWKDPREYKRVLFQRYSVEGLPFARGTVFVRWGTADVEPKTLLEQGLRVTKLPDQEVPANWSTIVPTRGSIGYRKRRYSDHER